MRVFKYILVVIAVIAMLIMAFGLGYTTAENECYRKNVLHNRFR